MPESASLMMLDARPALWPAGDWGSRSAKTYVTCDSHVVPHRSTEQAQWCLTSEFGWDPVLSPWYERMMRANLDGGTGGSPVQGPGL